MEGQIRKMDFKKIKKANWKIRIGFGSRVHNSFWGVGVGVGVGDIFQSGRNAAFVPHTEGSVTRAF